MSRYYGTAAWKRLRAQVLARQPICETAGCGRRSVHVDHIIPRSRGGTDTLGNLRGLCPECHNARRLGREPIAKGCNEAGTPRDPGHWWHQPAPENLSQLRAIDRVEPARRISSGRSFLGDPDSDAS